MRILLDHCVPRQLGKHLPSHQVRTTRAMRWELLRNGNLLATAAANFDVFLTVDKNIRRQQNLHSLPITVIELDVKNNTPEVIIPFAPYIEHALSRYRAGTLIVIHDDGSMTVYP